MMTMLLSASEQALVAQVSHDRTAAWEAAGHGSKKIDEDQSEVKITVTGLSGEYASARLLGGEFKTDVSVRGDGNVGDFTIKGLTIQVKATECPPPCRLLYREKEDFRARFTVLTHVCGPRVTFLGCIGRGRWMLKAKPDHVGRGRSWRVWSVDLSPIELLMRAIELRS